MPILTVAICGQMLITLLQMLYRGSNVLLSMGELLHVNSNEIFGRFDLASVEEKLSTVRDVEGE